MMEIANTMLSSELQVFLNYVYEYKKGESLSGLAFLDLLK